MAHENPSPKNRIILGVMNIGPDPSSGARITSLDEYNAILDYLQAQGYNEIDTAQMYLNGKQEPFTAAAHWKARGLKIATKLYPKPPAITHEPSSLRTHLRVSLDALQTDCVDIFYLHAPDRTTPFIDTLTELDKLHNEGQFRQLGLSNFAAFEVAEITTLCVERGWIRPTIYQGMYNVITRSIEPELIAACRRYGLDIVAYNPLAGGLFSGKYSSKADAVTSGRFNMDTDQARRYRDRYFRDVYFEAIDTIKAVIDPLSISPVEVALRWLIHHSELRLAQHGAGNDGVIIGISSLEQLKSNLSYLEKGPLPDQVVEALDAAWYIAKANCPNYWHGELKYTYDNKI